MSFLKGYRCLDPKTSRVYISHDVYFHEASFPYLTLCHSLPHVSETSIFDHKDILSLAFTSTASHATLSVSGFPSPHNWVLLILYPSAL